MPEDDDVEKAKKLKELAELERDRLRAELETRELKDSSAATVSRLEASAKYADAVSGLAKALVPEGADGLATAALPDKALIEGQFLAYWALAAIAKDIAADLGGDEATKDATLIVHGDGAMKCLIAYQQFIANLGLLKRSYERLSRIISDPSTGGRARQDEAPRRALLPPPVLAALPLARFAFDVLPLLRPSTEAISTVDITVNESSLVAAIGRALGPGRIAYPQLLARFTNPSDSDLLQGFDTIDDLRHDIRTKAETREKALKSYIEAELERLDKDFDLLRALLQKADDSGGYPLGAALRGEALSRALEENSKAYLIHLSHVGAAASARIVWQWLPPRRRLRHGGGAVVAMLIIDKDGTVVKSGVYGRYSGPTLESDVARTLP